MFPSDKDHNRAHNFNVTNLHTHGLHVSPSGISDNVLLRVMPGESQYYEIKIPKNHPAGTFWYHAHVHGSTAIQVASGLVGMIVIEGDLGSALKARDIESKQFLFQQIPWDEHGVLESTRFIKRGGFTDSRRPRLINGQVRPNITLKAGEVQRWRFVASLAEDGLKLSIVDDEGKLAGKLHEFATDGINTGRIDAWEHLTLFPGYRSDVLFQAPSIPSIYYLEDSIPIEQDLLKPDAVGKKRKWLQIEVTPNELDITLPTSDFFKPYKAMIDFTEEEIAGFTEPDQEAFFSIDFDEELQQLVYSINGAVFDHHHVRYLPFGKEERWRLRSSENQVHPFHIHVNAFQMTRKGPDGKPQTVWKDTVLTTPEPLDIYTRYEDFKGRFVLHCHFLFHEDFGMMEQVEIK